MPKYLFFFKQPGRIEAGPVFGHLYDGVLFVYAYGDSSARPEILFYRKWTESPEAAKVFLKAYAKESLKAEPYVVKLPPKPGDDGPTFTVYGG